MLAVEAQPGSGAAHVMWSLLSVMGSPLPPATVVWECGGSGVEGADIILPGCVPLDHTIWLGRKNIAEKGME